jgi:predicted AAA+ superfamily ATPase
MLMRWEKIQVQRMSGSVLPEGSDKGIVLITGARQTGKTTLVKGQYASLPYYNLDSMELRHQLTEISAFDWGRDVGNAVIDEIQKAPSLLEKIKFGYDEGGLTFSVLTGSSQIMLLKNVRESLAGRIEIHELFPFIFCELNEPIAERRAPILLSGILEAPVIVLPGLPSACIFEEPYQPVD